MSNTKGWSEFHMDYISHYGNVGDGRRATVCKYGEAFVELLLWYQGCGFNPKKVEFRSVLEAQEYGKAWVDGEIL